ncbi:MAG TPA: hypothetical protein VG984_00770 [Candidatus Paceibacterota bacterium]|nr:hypothetical protein [Candidatus Paceibacterota bacterium]
MEKKTRVALQAVVLKTIATAGLLSVVLVAPNVIGALDKVGLLGGKKQFDSIQRARRNLIRKGLLTIRDGKLRLTQKGEQRLEHLELLNYEIPKPKRWDRKWRILIFDIPERRKGLRDKVRQTLRRVGFAHLQDSVWIFPYDCEELVTLLKADFKIGKDMLYMTVELLERDAPIRDLFELH